MTPVDLAALERLLAEATPIPGFPGYLATSSGSIISGGHNWRGYGARALIPATNRHGYLYVKLTVNGRRVKSTVHKLVALTFLGPPVPPQDQVRHLDGNRQNNAVRNLAWGTAKDNAGDRTRHGTAATGERNAAAVLTSTQVNEILVKLQSGMTQKAVARRYGVSARAVKFIATGETWKHVPRPNAYDAATGGTDGK